MGYRGFQEIIGGISFRDVTRVFLRRFRGVSYALLELRGGLTGSGGASGGLELLIIHFGSLFSVTGGFKSVA